MKIVIAGGTGFIGQHLAKYFLQKGHEISIISRSSKHVKNIYGETVHVLTWKDLSSADLQAVDVIINLAGANIADKLWTTQRKQEIVYSRIASTQQLISIVSQLSGNKPLFICASGVSIYPADKQCYAETTTQIASHTFMGKLAQEWESATFPAKEAGARVVNMRLGVVLDRSGGMLAKLEKIYRFGLGARIGSGLQAFPWISLADVIRGIAFVIDHPALHGPINFIAPEQINQMAFAKTFARVLHKPCFLTLPAKLLKLLPGQMADELLLNGQYAIPKKLLDNGFTFCFPTLAAALKQK